MKAVYFKALLLAVLLVFFAGIASANAAPPFPAWQFAVAPGYSYQYGLDGDHHGFCMDASAGWRFWDSVLLKGQLEYAVHNNPKEKAYRSHMVTPSLGLEYELDFLPITPYFGAGIGPYAHLGYYPHNDWQFELGAYYYVGFSGFVHRWTSLGVEIESHHYLTGEDDTTPSGYLNISAQVQFYFD